MISARWMAWMNYSTQDEPEQGACETRVRNGQEDQLVDSLASDKALNWNADRRMGVGVGVHQTLQKEK